MQSLGYGKEYAYNPAFAHPVINAYLPTELSGSRFLLDAGDTSEKAWDEMQLQRWEKEMNNGAPWEGRIAAGKLRVKSEEDTST